MLYKVCKLEIRNWQVRVNSAWWQRWLYSVYRTTSLLTCIPFYVQVRLPLIDSGFLTDLVQTNEFIRKCLICRLRIQAAISYQENPNDYSGVLPLELLTPRDQMLGNIYVVSGAKCFALKRTSYSFELSWKEMASLNNEPENNNSVASLLGELYVTGGHHS